MIVLSQQLPTRISPMLAHLSHGCCLAVKAPVPSPNQLTKERHARNDAGQRNVEYFEGARQSTETHARARKSTQEHRKKRIRKTDRILLLLTSNTKQAGTEVGSVVAVGPTLFMLCSGIYINLIYTSISLGTGGRNFAGLLGRWDNRFRAIYARFFEVLGQLQPMHAGT